MTTENTPSVLANYNQNRMSPFDEQALRLLLGGRKGLRILEVGSWLGAGSTQILAEHAAELVCVDHWRGSQNAAHAAIAAEVDPFRIFCKNTEKYADRIIPICCESARAASILVDNSFDFVFIDGDHRYSQTAMDIRLYGVKVRVGGMLAGHDCEARLSKVGNLFKETDFELDHVEASIGPFRHVHPGVIRAVSEVFGDKVGLFADESWHLTLEDGDVGYSTIWFVKRG